MEAQVDVDATGYHLNTDADLLASRQAMFAGGAPTRMCGCLVTGH